MNPQKLDFTKPITTRDGRKVRILCTDGPRTDYPVIGFPSTSYYEYHWSLDGRSRSGESCDDLINPPIKRKVEFWVNVYEGKPIDFGLSYLSKEKADKNASNFEKRIACLHFTREYEEGEGL